MTAESLIGKEWAEFLPKAEDLLMPIQKRLKAEIDLGYNITPMGKDKIFRIFHLIKPGEIRVLILGQDPYHSPRGQATGVAFECGKFPSPSWNKIADIYKREIISPDPAVTKGTLTKWTTQGVFLLNKALTVREKNPGSHIILWADFIRYVVSNILTDLSPKAVIVLGAEAKKVIPKVSAPHAEFYYEHPAAASYQRRDWNAKGIFTSVNQFLSFHNKTLNW